MIAAADFFTVEVWTRRGLDRFLVLFFIDLATRKVEIAGIAPVVNGLWMSPVARNLTDTGKEVLAGKRYLIHDRLMRHAVRRRIRDLNPGAGGVRQARDWSVCMVIRGGLQGAGWSPFLPGVRNQLV
jgi:hypothetical protein